MRALQACSGRVLAQTQPSPLPPPARPLLPLWSLFSWTSSLLVESVAWLGSLALDFAGHSSASPRLWCLLCPPLPSLAHLAATPTWVCLAQGRLSEEIEKLRQEVDQLKGRGGPFVDGVHSRYWSMGGWTCWDGSWVDPEDRDFLPPKTAQDLRSFSFSGGTLRLGELGQSHRAH